MAFKNLNIKGAFTDPLKYYKDKEYIIRQKVKSLYILCLFSLVIVTVLSTHMYFMLDLRAFTIQFPFFFCFTLTIIILIILYKGNHELAMIAYLFITTGLIWTMMFLEIDFNHDKPIFVLDTIVYLYTQLVIAALLSESRKLFVPLYYVGNITILLLYTLHVDSFYDLPEDFVMEYFIDNLLSFILIFIITNTVRSFNDKALNTVKLEVSKNKELNETLENRVVERTAKLKEAQGQLIDKAHKAGKAEVAASILHNIGNILTSITTSSETINSQAQDTKIKTLVKASLMLHEHKEHLTDFFETEKGKNLLSYFFLIGEALEKENSCILKHSERLIANIENINKVIKAQEEYLNAESVVELADVNKMIVEIVETHQTLFEKSGIVITTDLTCTKSFKFDRVKFVQIVFNLLMNAKESLEEAGNTEKLIEIKAYNSEESVFVTIYDNGLGVDKKEIHKIFNSGYSSKKNRNGFGLHSSANFISEMGGHIDVSSEGLGKGAQFTLTVPFDSIKKN